jgi:hypothetical protein
MPEAQLFIRPQLLPYLGTLPTLQNSFVQVRHVPQRKQLLSKMEPNRYTNSVFATPQKSVN